MRPHPLKYEHITEIQRQKGWPPANGQVLTVHAIQRVVQRDPGWFESDKIDERLATVVN